MERRDFLRKGSIGALWLAGFGSFYYIYSDIKERLFLNEILEINRSGYKQKYNTIVHDLSGQETSLGAGPADKYLLDNILDKILERTADCTVGDEETATRFSRTIDEVMEDEGVGKYMRADGCSLHRGLTKERKLDCFGLSTIYYAASELKRIINLDIVVLPGTAELSGHICLKSRQGGFYWNPIEAKKITRDYYQKQRSISDKSIRDGLYLSALDRNGILSVGYEKVAWEWYAKGYLDRAIEFLKKAIELDQKNIGAYNNLGAFFYEKGNFIEAVEWYKKALELDPDYYDSRVGLNSTYKKIRGEKIYLP